MEQPIRQPYGLVLVCPKCSDQSYYGMLKTPGNRASPCPNCGTALIALRKRNQTKVTQSQNG